MLPFQQAPQANPRAHADPAAQPQPAAQTQTQIPVPTSQALLNAFPAEIRSILQNAMNQQDIQKTRLVQRVLNAPRNPYSKEQLDGMQLGDLEQLVNFASVPNYAGAGAGVGVGGSTTQEDKNAPPEPPSILSALQPKEDKPATATDIAAAAAAAATVASKQQQAA